MRKHFVTLMLVLICLTVCAPFAHAEPATAGAGTGSSYAPSDTSFVPLAPIPGLDQGVDATGQGIATFLNNLYFFVIGIAVILAGGMIIYGGVEYALSEVPSMKGDGRRKITQALLGLVLVLAPALVFGIINPAILNLNVNFEPLKTTWGNYQGSTGVQPNSENMCTGTDCSTQATQCSGGNGLNPEYAVYQCVSSGYSCANAEGHIRISDTKPIACNPGEVYCLACSTP